MSSPGWPRAANVLAVRLDALGDVIMTTPALRALKESFPGRRLTLLTSPAGAQAAALVPQIDEALVYESPWMKATPLRTDAAPDLAQIDLLRRRGFDAAVIFTVYSQNPLPAALFCHLAGIPLRLAHCRENPYQLLTDWVPDPEPDRGIRHEVRRQLDLVDAVGCRTADERLALRPPALAWHRARHALEAAGIDAVGNWVAIHPGASAESRRYPAEGFAEVARRLRRETGCQVVFTGSAAECELVEAIRARMRCRSVSLAGGLDFAELTALVGLAPVLITNNTGPAHVAAAMDTPVVVLYALTNPQHTPWAARARVLFHDVPCKFCYKSVCREGHHNCLRLVTPAQVVEAAQALLGEAGARAGCHGWHSRGTRNARDCRLRVPRLCEPCRVPPCDEPRPSGSG